MAIDLSVYKKIINVLFGSFIVCLGGLIIIQTNNIECWLKIEFGQIGFQLLNQFLYGALGGTIAGSLFLKKDKEINEIESLKPKPNPTILRLPDEVDKSLYIHRIITSGVLAVLGTLLIITGFGYLEVEYKDGFVLRQEIFFIITSVLIGLYQIKFLGRIEKLFESFFRSGS
ncbi:hypothetical protein [Flagellimonas marina]|uniref:Uncharacterized protein n=1 Tax=Flagellimonas marina TaxID=1775168 RepID=A0ABV8PL25_9FLAO